MIKYNPVPAEPYKTTHKFENLDWLLRTEEAHKWIPTRKVGNNLRLDRRTDGIALRFYETDLITWHPDQTITLRVGEWLTTSTRTHLQNWLPRYWSDTDQRWDGVKILCEENFWMVRLAGQGTVCFHDGMIVDLQNYTEFTPPYDNTADKEFNKMIDKQIRAYVKCMPPIDTWSNRVISMQSQNEAQTPVTEILNKKIYTREVISMVWGYVYYMGFSHEEHKRQLRAFFKRYAYRGPCIRPTLKFPKSPMDMIR